MALALLSTLNTPRIDYSPFLLQTRMHGPIDLSLSSLDGWCWSKCHIIQMQYLQLFFFVDPLRPVSQLKPILWSTNLSGVTSTRQLATFSKFFYGLPIDPLLTFKDSFISLAKTPLKCLISCLLTLQQSHFKLPIGPRSC